MIQTMKTITRRCKKCKSVLEGTAEDFQKYDLECPRCGHIISRKRQAQATMKISRDKLYSSPSSYNKINKSGLISKSNSPKSSIMTKKFSLLKLILIISGVLILVGLFSPEGKEDQFASSLQKLQDLNHQFSIWDGSYVPLTKLIKEQMNDPSSYEHVNTTYRDLGDHLIVTTVFRGKNAFGAIMKNSITVKTDSSGNITELINYDF